ncbi:MAG: M1 family metallopeptidase [Pyrinomonadaceae bacterium]
MKIFIAVFFAPLLLSVSAECKSLKNVFDFVKPVDTTAKQEIVKDVHSLSNPADVRVTDVALDWDVNFQKKIIKGSAVLTFKRSETGLGKPLVLDTNNLRIEEVEVSTNGGKSFQITKYLLAKPVEYLGQALTINIPDNSDRVKIYYQTSPNAAGLQWLTPSQTADKKAPFMFSQGQAILARSYIPLQDTPQARITYSATVRTPKGLLAVMSAAGNSESDKRNGIYKFRLDKPIPSYLIAIAVGDVKFKSTGPRSGVYAEPSVVENAAKEFEDTEKMIEATEAMYGPYRWGRYDLIVLPPSFPYGGMENPMLTFATPTVIAGDKSLVSLVAHELAHSWSGNLVTNATWSDSWMNEGFTNYLTYRIIEAVYGKDRYEMEAALGKNELLADLKNAAQRDQVLKINLDGRDPDAGSTGIAYEKGALFLRFLDEKFGRAEFDKFLRGYFDSHRFQSITTGQFVEYLNENLLAKKPGFVSEAEVDEWVTQPGLPANAPSIVSFRLEKVDGTIAKYNAGADPKTLDTNAWTTQEWLRFLRGLPAELSANQMAKLDETFNFTNTGNSEIEFQWLLMSIHNQYKPAEPMLETFLTTVGRRKFVKPLFEELIRTPEGRVRAQEIYKRARSGYHAVTYTAIDRLLGKDISEPK